MSFSVPPPHLRSPADEALWKWFARQRADINREYTATFRRLKLTVGDSAQHTLSLQWALSLTQIEAIATALQAASTAGHLTIQGTRHGLIISNALVIPPRKRNRPGRSPV